MTASAGVPLYFASGVFTGEYVEEHEARVRIRAGKARFTREGPKGRRLISTAPDEPIKRERALIERDAAGAALSCTYEEALYPGVRTKEFTPPTTAYCISLKKARTHKSGVVEMVPYREVESFRKRRFNPDHIQVPFAPRRTAGVPSFWSA